MRRKKNCNPLEVISLAVLIFRSPRKKVGFSFGRFACQVLYGVWTGLLGVILSSLLFKNTTDRLALTLMSAFGVASGVWLVGCCGNRKCAFSYAWVASLTTAIFTIYWADSNTVRSLVFMAATSALNSNRGVRQKALKKYISTDRQYAVSIV